MSVSKLDLGLILLALALRELMNFLKIFFGGAHAILGTFSRELETGLAVCPSREFVLVSASVWVTTSPGVL